MAYSDNAKSITLERVGRFDLSQGRIIAHTYKYVLFTSIAIV